MQTNSLPLCTMIDRDNCSCGWKGVKIKKWIACMKNENINECIDNDEQLIAQWWKKER